jgi:hypothetical protein
MSRTQECYRSSLDPTYVARHLGTIKGMIASTTMGCRALEKPASRPIQLIESVCTIRPQERTSRNPFKPTISQLTTEISWFALEIPEFPFDPKLNRTINFFSKIRTILG